MTQIGPIASILYDWSFFSYFVIYCSHMNKNVKLLCYQIFFPKLIQNDLSHV